MENGMKPKLAGHVITCHSWISTSRMALGTKAGTILIMEEAASNQLILAGNEGQLKLADKILTELQAAIVTQSPRETRLIDLGTVEEMNRLYGQEVGIAEVGYRLSGPFAYGYMNCERGTHRLARVSPFNAEGKRIGRIDLPERCANLCFGGLRRNRLFMAASTSVYSIYVNTQGVLGG